MEGFSVGSDNSSASSSSTERTGCLRVACSLLFCLMRPFPLHLENVQNLVAHHFIVFQSLRLQIEIRQKLMRAVRFSYCCIRPDRSNDRNAILLAERLDHVHHDLSQTDALVHNG